MCFTSPSRPHSPPEPPALIADDGKADDAATAILGLKTAVSVARHLSMSIEPFSNSSTRILSRNSSGMYCKAKTFCSIAV
jgi:hypothetical protein